MRSKGNILSYHLMLMPGMVFLLIFSIIPMVGIVIAFQNYMPTKGFFGSPWVGLDNIKFMLTIPDSRQVFVNTIVISIGKVVANLVVPIAFSLLLNEVTHGGFKRISQTVFYMPHFLSWAVLGGIAVNLLASDGLVNRILISLGGSEVPFLSSNKIFRSVLIVSNTWKEFGYSTIVYMAALTAISPNLHEAAAIDGAGRLRRLWHVTLPGMMPTIVLMSTLSLGSVLNAGFDQILALYNPAVYASADVIDTYVYRMGLRQAQYSMAAAVGIIKSGVSFVLIAASYVLANKLAGYRIF